MGILADGIFMNPRYDQYEDYGETQSYYDLRTGIIYVVMEEYGIVVTILFRKSHQIPLNIRQIMQDTRK